MNRTDTSWLCWAIATLEADQMRSADTHLVKLDLPEFAQVDVYLKDESTHPTGSLKHRLARSLFLYGLCNGWIAEGKPIVEASSGSTAISEAYFARMLGLPFIAVVPQGTAPAKLAEIERLGGRCHAVAGSDIYSAADALAREIGGHYMDQFTFAERATDWRGNNNIAESIFQQMQREPHPLPRWIVVGAGTGGTSATIGRYVRYKACGEARTLLAVVDPEGSVFAESHRTGRSDLVSDVRSRIEGIGRPRVEPSFQPSVIDRMIEVADADSFAAALWLSERLGRPVGPSTGTNLVGVFALAREMARADEGGSIVTLICDNGERYRDTLFNAAWLAGEPAIAARRAALEAMLAGT
jgi:cysteine synthase A